VHRVRTFVKQGLRRVGYEVSAYSVSVPGQRAQILRHLGIDTVVDVGANVGQYAQSLRHIGYRGEIVSLEPLRVPYNQLVTAATSDPHWQTQRTAVGARVGELRLHVSEASIFSSALTVLSSTVAASRDARTSRDEIVPMTTLDELLAGTPLKSTAIKIDVQGFERDVLEGAQKSLRSVPLLEIELSPRPVYEGQMLIVEALERLQAAGLVLSAVENLFRDADSGRSLQFNGIFVREPRVPGRLRHL
jgi:FkbM family methyltransferase